MWRKRRRKKTLNIENPFPPCCCCALRSLATETSPDEDSPTPSQPFQKMCIRNEV